MKGIKYLVYLYVPSCIFVISSSILDAVINALVIFYFFKIGLVLRELFDITIQKFCSVLSPISLFFLRCKKSLTQLSVFIYIFYGLTVAHLRSYSMNYRILQIDDRIFGTVKHIT